MAAAFELVRGFAVGRTIFGDVARGWMKGETTDANAVNEMARRYARLCDMWDEARTRAEGPTRSLNATEAGSPPG